MIISWQGCGTPTRAFLIMDCTPTVDKFMKFFCMLYGKMAQKNRWSKIFAHIWKYLRYLREDSLLKEEAFHAHEAIQAVLPCELPDLDFGKGEIDRSTIEKEKETWIPILKLCDQIQGLSDGHPIICNGRCCWERIQDYFDLLSRFENFIKMLKRTKSKCTHHMGTAGPFHVPLEK